MNEKSTLMHGMELIKLASVAQLASYILRVVLQDEVSRPPRLKFLWMKKLLFLIIFFAPPVWSGEKARGPYSSMLNMWSPCSNCIC
jgi:hypothetical protein